MDEQMLKSLEKGEMGGMSSLKSWIGKMKDPRYHEALELSERPWA